MEKRQENQSMSNPITLPVLITSLATKVDGSIAIKLETRELSPQDSAVLFELRGTEAWAIISPSELNDPKIPEASPDPSIQKKTASKRLRDRLYIYYTKALERNPDEFEYWYDKELERIGQRYLERIEQQ